MWSVLIKMLLLIGAHGVTRCCNVMIIKLVIVKYNLGLFNWLGYEKELNRFSEMPNLKSLTAGV